MSGEATTPRGWFDFCHSYQPTGPIPAKAGIGCASSTHQAVLDASPGVGVDGSPHRELHARPHAAALSWCDWALPAGVWPTQAAMLPMLL